MKKIIIIILSAVCVDIASGCMFLGSQVEASAIKCHTYSTSEREKNDIDYIKKHTILSSEKITYMLAKGNKKKDIENLYILHDFIHKDYEQLINEYQDADKKIDVLMVKYNINKSEFESVFDRTFPKNEATEFDRVLRNKNLRYLPF